MTRQDPDYVMGRSEHETRRLQRQAQLYSPLTRRLLVDAGIGQGMRVLDVGSGAGDVALLIAELVGPTGAVVGVDPNHEILEVARQRALASGWTNVTFVDGDIRTATIGDDAFDAAIGRFVVFWVSDPVDVLRACASRVRVGGVVAFQEHDTLALYKAVPANEIVEWWCRLATMLMKQRGLDAGTAYRLFEDFLTAGFAAPQMHYEAPIGGGPDWVGYDMLADHARSLAPFMIEAGLASWNELDIDQMADRVRSEITAQHGVLRCIPAVGAWARVQPGAGT